LLAQLILEITGEILLLLTNLAAIMFLKTLFKYDWSSVGCVGVSEEFTVGHGSSWPIKAYIEFIEDPLIFAVGL
jgi:hypothetical protein